MQQTHWFRRIVYTVCCLDTEWFLVTVDFTHGNN